MKAGKGRASERVSKTPRGALLAATLLSVLAACNMTHNSDETATSVHDNAGGTPSLGPDDIATDNGVPKGGTTGNEATGTGVAGGAGGTFDNLRGGGATGGGVAGYAAGAGMGETGDGLAATAAPKPWPADLSVGLDALAESCMLTFSGERGGNCWPDARCTQMRQEGTPRPFECWPAWYGIDGTEQTDMERSATASCAISWLEALGANDVVLSGNNLAATGEWALLEPLASALELECQLVCIDDSCEYCRAYDSQDCDADAFCRSVSATPINVEDACADPVDFAACMPDLLPCTADPVAALDTDGSCWHMQGGCALPGFDVATARPGVPDCPFTYFQNCDENTSSWPLPEGEDCEFLSEYTPLGNCNTPTCRQLRSAATPRDLSCSVRTDIEKDGLPQQLSDTERAFRAACVGRQFELLGATSVQISENQITARGGFEHFEALMAVEELSCSVRCGSGDCDYCRELGEQECEADAFCRSRVAGRIDTDAQCREKSEFVECAPLDWNLCSDIPLVGRDAEGACWFVDLLCMDLGLGIRGDESCGDSNTLRLCPEL